MTPRENLRVGIEILRCAFVHGGRYGFECGLEGNPLLVLNFRVFYNVDRRSIFCDECVPFSRMLGIRRKLVYRVDWPFRALGRVWNWVEGRGR